RAACQDTALVGISQTTSKSRVRFDSWSENPLNFSPPRATFFYGTPIWHIRRAAMTDRVDQLYERLLILRCQAGDPAGFAELVGLHNARLWYYVRKLWGDVHGAEDLLQDVWFDVFRGLPRLSEPEAFRAWLYRIARLRVFRWLRKRRPGWVPLAEADWVQEEPADDEFCPEDVARIHVALSELAVEHREMIV